MKTLPTLSAPAWLLAMQASAPIFDTKDDVEFPDLPLAMICANAVPDFNALHPYEPLEPEQSIWLGVDTDEVLSELHQLSEAQEMAVYEAVAALVDGAEAVLPIAGFSEFFAPAGTLARIESELFNLVNKKKVLSGLL